MSIFPTPVRPYLGIDAQSMVDTPDIKPSPVPTKTPPLCLDISKIAKTVELAAQPEIRKRSASDAPSSLSFKSLKSLTPVDQVITIHRPETNTLA